MPWFELFYSNISVSDKLFGEIAAAVDLQTDSSGIGMAFLGFGPLHELDPVNPSSDGGGVVDDASTHFVPLAVTPEIRPGLDQNGQGRGRVGLLHDNSDLVCESKIHNRRFSAEPAFTVNPHEIAARVVVDHGLVGRPILRAAQKQTAVRAEIVVHLEDDLKVSKLFIRDENAAVARDILAAGNRAVFDYPSAAGLVFAGTAMAGFGAGVQAVQGLAVEDRDEPILVRFSSVGPRRCQKGQDGE